ncbi:MAG TPA: MFS transporter [Conexibacter sp.]|jgi:EmrB/QacA subfamily drug resistance transporter
MSQPTTSRRASATIIVACIATAMLVLDISVINTALSDISDGLGTGLSGLQWVIDAYTLPLAAVVLTAGSLADRFGRKRAFVLGLAIFTAASAVCGVSGSIGVLVAARAVQGIGAAILFAVSLALIAQVTPTHAARTKAMALYGGTIGGALAIGPFVGGVLTDVVSWRAIFLINVPLGIAGLWMTITQVAESRDSRARKVDVPGQVALVAGLFGIVLGLLRANEDGWGSPVVLISLIAGGLLVLTFGLIETRSREPMLPLALFRQQDFAGVQLSVFAVSSSLFALFLYLSLYLQGPLGLSPLETGLVYLPGSISMFLVSGATPQIAARIGNGRLATLGLALVAGSLALMLLLQADSSWWLTLPATMLGFIGAGLYNPAISVIALGALPEEQSGLAAGAYDTFRQSGIALGTAALGAFVPAAGAFGGVAATDSYVNGFHHAALVALGIAVVGTVAAGVLIGRKHAAVPKVATAAPVPAPQPLPAGVEVIGLEPAYEIRSEGLPPAA